VEIIKGMHKILLSALVFFATFNLFGQSGFVANSSVNIVVLGGTTVNVQGTITLKNSSTVDNNGKINLTEDWINNAGNTGLINSSPGEVELLGDTQYVAGTDITHFSDLTLTGTGVKILQVNTIVEDSLSLTDREFMTDSNRLYITSTDTMAITRSTGFISSLDTGSVARNTSLSASYVFPTGSSAGTTRYRQVDITPVTTNPHTYAVRMANVDATTEGYDISIKQIGIGAINPNWYHRINRTAGTDLADVTIYYDGVSDSSSMMVHWETQWEDMGTITNSGSAVTRAGWNDFSPNPFALAGSQTVVDAGANDSICLGDSSQLVATVTSGVGPYSYSWTPTTTLSDSTIANPIATPTTTTTYYVTVYDSGTSTTSLPDSVVVFVNPTFNTVDAPLSICSGDSALIYGTYEFTAATYYDSLISVNGCDSVHSTVLTLNPTYSISVEDTVCNGDSILLPGGSYVSIAGSYSDTIPSVAACDSIITTTLVVNSVTNDSIAVGICTGDSLQLPGGSYESTSGVYIDTLVSTAGCDSIIITTLTVDSVIINNINTSICNGDSILIDTVYQFTAGVYTDTSISISGCDSIAITTLTIDSVYNIALTDTICSGDSIQLPGGSYVSAGGIYIDTLSSTAGCDSILTTSLTVNPVIAVGANDTVCAGDSIQLPGGNYVSTAGSYIDTLSTVSGCDSIITTLLVVNTVSYDSVSVGICTGDSLLLPGGSYASSSGVYIDSLTSSAGCDSIIITKLAVDSVIINNINASICNGDSILIGGVYQLAAGTYSDTSTSVGGCDSITVTTLSVDSVYSFTLTDTICSGDSVQLPGGSYASAGGTYVDSLSTSVGCDSIFTTTLTVNQAFSFSDTVNLCFGDSTLLPGGSYTDTAGLYIDSLTSISGCDSIYTTNVIIDSASLTNVSASICEGDSILLGGNYQDTAGTYTDSLVSINGCDSLVITVLTIDSAFSANLFDTICAGDSIQLPGGNYVFVTGVYTDTLTTAAGCDSVITTDLTVNPRYIITGTVGICSGDSTQLPGGTYVLASGVYTDSLTTLAGCDSVFTTTVTVDIGQGSLDTVIICLGDSVMLGGSFQTTAGTYQDTMTSVNGCDSIVITELFVSDPANSTSNFNDTICDTDSILLGGAYQNTAGMYSDTLVAANGCDSIVITTLVVNTCDEPHIYIPNAFSPGAGKSTNQLLHVYGVGVKSLTFIIYDRWGEKLYEFEQASSSDICMNELCTEGWDGTHNGKALNAAVFVYYVKAEFTNDEIIEKQGNIALIK